MTTLSVDRLREMKLSVSVPLLITILSMSYYGAVRVNGWYDGYHRQIAREEAKAIMVAQSENLEKRVEDTQKAVEELSGQVSSLQVSAAIAAVAALQTELDRHERSPEDSLSWRKERDRLTRQIVTAIEYRECLLDERPNCNLLRGW